MKNLLLILFLSINISFAQKPNTTEELEITETNIAEHPYLKSDKISVFGIKLGMTKDEVYKTLDKNKDLEYGADFSHMSRDFRVYVYDKNIDPEDNTILYLIWTDAVKELNKIVFFEPFEKFLIGNTKTFFSFDFLDPNSNLYKYYLGKSDREEVTLDIPLIKLKHVSYFYDSKGLSFTNKTSKDKKSVAFSFYK